jgi:uncharacterized protein Yka (UPF0111/DUF47 family)
MTIAMALSSWSMASMVTIREKIAVIESSRFTAQDGVKLQQSLLGAVPPAWFVKRIDAMSAKIDKLDQVIGRLDRIEKRIDNLERK